MDRFDIVHAHYLFYMWNHEGQGSRKSRRLNKILSYYTPGYYQQRDPYFENDAQREIYTALCHKHGITS